MYLADYSLVVLKNASDFLHSKDEKIKIKGVELVMKSVEAQEKAKEEAKLKEKEAIDVEVFLKQIGILDNGDKEGWITYHEDEMSQIMFKMMSEMMFKFKQYNGLSGKKRKE